MNHMQFIESVALSDCAVLEDKEGTYQGSWKRGGGRSAWFMAKRNMDRLNTMMPAKPVGCEISSLENIRGTLMSLKQTVHYNFAPLNQTVAPLPGSIEGTMAVLDHVLDSYTADDVFMRIAKNPKGEDGTVLACIRDLRRYFILVEAEMLAEGVVENESKTYEQDHYPQDVYTMIADETGLDREEVKRRCHLACYGDDELTVKRDKVTVQINTRGSDSASYTFPNATNVVVTYGPAILTIDLERGEIGQEMLDALNVRAPGSFGTAPLTMEDIGQDRRGPPTPREPPPIPKTVDVHASPIFAGGLVHEAGRPPRLPTSEEQLLLDAQRATYNMRDADETRHGSLVPWEIGDAYRDTLISRVGGELINAFYNKRAINMYRLEPVVDGQFKCPREINQCYDYQTWELPTEPPMRRHYWLLKRADLPAELASQYPFLQQEMNTFEYEQSPSEFRFMYFYAREKWILMPQFTIWAREA